MNELMMDSQDELLVRLRRGEEQAFAEFVQTNTGRMLCVARRLLRNEHDAADALQDAFISAFKSLPQFSGESSLSTWLHRIVINSCLMKLRSRSRLQDCLLDDLLPHFDQSGHHVEPVCHWSSASFDRLTRDESKACIHACIDQLSEDYRTVLILRDIEEFDTEQTAAMLKVSIGTIKTRLHRARQALRTLLEPHFV